MLARCLFSRLVLLAVFLSACGGAPPYRAAATVARSAVYDPKHDASFFSAPWPDDRRRDAAGRVPTADFPNPGKSSLAANIFQTGDGLLSGFGLAAPVYQPFSGPLDPASLRGAVSLVAIDRDSGFYAEPVPVDWQLTTQDGLYLPANVLAVRPLPTSPLRPSTTYALLVTTAARDTAGRPIGPDASLWAGLFPASNTKPEAHYQKLNAYLEDRKIEADTLAAAVVFTTQPIVDELLVLRDFLVARPAPAIEGLVLDSTRPSAYVFSGTYRAPMLQHGTVPYLTGGGDFRFAADGTPIAAREEDLRVAFCVPRVAMPAKGFPVVIYSHGTGGNFRSFVGDICDDLADVGIASFGIDQVMHGPRAPAGTSCFGQAAELCFFNPVNAVAGRNNARQAALDNFPLEKLIDGLIVPASAHPDGVSVRFDLAHLGFFGHSQGGLTGALYAAISPGLDVAVLSGAGGYLTHTVLERKDPFDLRALAEGPMLLNLPGQESLDVFHPALALMQTLAEAADPLSYARLWLREPATTPKHLYVTSGLMDPYSPPTGAAVLAEVAGLPLIAADAGPTSANVAGHTAVFRQFPDQGHYAAFRDAVARAEWRELFRSAFYDDAPRVP